MHHPGERCECPKAHVAFCCLSLCTEAARQIDYYDLANLKEINSTLNLIWTLLQIQELSSFFFFFFNGLFCLFLFPLQRDGCPKIVNLGSSKTDLFYERKKYGFKKRWRRHGLVLDLVFQLLKIFFVSSRNIFWHVNKALFYIFVFIFPLLWMLKNSRILTGRLITHQVLDIYISATINKHFTVPKHKIFYSSTRLHPVRFSI